MPSLIHSSPLLNCRTIAYLNSLPLLELGTDLPRPSPGVIFGFSPVNYSDSDNIALFRNTRSPAQNKYLIDDILYEQKI